MNDQKKSIAWIGGVVVLIVVVIGGIFGVKHYMTEKTYEKPINAILKIERKIGDSQVAKDNSKITVYDDPDKDNDYLIVITFYSKEESSTLTNQFVVDKTTNYAEYQGEQMPISNLKKLYESDHLKK